MSNELKELKELKELMNTSTTNKSTLNKSTLNKSTIDKSSIIKSIVNTSVKNTSMINTVPNIIKYIEDHILEELSPKSIAEHFYLSVTTLNNLFKIVCDMTTMEYARNRRLSLAGEELKCSNIPIIELAYKYGYETPEAFTKAFTRFHGFPPSFVRRTYPKLKVFHPLQIKIEVYGGWDEQITEEETLTRTKQSSSRQESNPSICYDKTIKIKGGLPMENVREQYHIHVNEMTQKEDWRVLLRLSERLNQGKIKFKVDGKTMIFAHGLEFKLEKICLTFNWTEEDKVKEFFAYAGNAISSITGFKYFDVLYEDMKVRCMFYEDCTGKNADECLFRNAEPVDIDGQVIYVQSLEFYYENAEPDDIYYKMVEEFLKRS